jgi:cell division protease FtsH
LSRRWILLLVVAAIGTVGFLAATRSEPSESVDRSYASFLADVRADRVSLVTIDTETGAIEGVGTDGERFSVAGPPGVIPDADLALLEAHDVARNYVAPSSGGGWGSLLALVLPFALIGLVIWALSRRTQSPAGTAAGFARSPGKVHTTERPAVTFEDIAGYDAVKDEVQEVVRFLRDPARFRAIGARIPKGLLLVGPPGTGKTLFAKAVAGEAEVPFISVTGSDFMEMFVGVGAARVRGLFEEARTHAPSIVFVDEIDSIGRTRGTGLGGGHDEREQTLNQLLSEMDGFDTAEGIVVMAATNRPDILDPALLRAGRFDRQVLIPLPTLDERVAILRVHGTDKRLADDVDLEVVARGTPGMSGADLANLVNEAALAAVRRDDDTVHRNDFETARDRVLMGLRRTSLALTDDEKLVIAHHEAGHAVMAILCEQADPVHKVTILPTGLALGVTQQLPRVERHLYTRRYLLDMIAVQLSGRAAEELVFDDQSTGAANDLSEATQTARRMVREWGMSDKLGPMAWGAQGPVFLGQDLVHTRDYSDATAHLIDGEVERILTEQEARARATLHQHRGALAAVARQLVEHETLDGDTVAAIVAASGSAPVSLVAPASA